MRQASHCGGMCFFVGAALSKRSPSLLPLGRELRDDVLGGVVAWTDGPFRRDVASVTRSSQLPLTATATRLSRMQLEHLLLIASESPASDADHLLNALGILDVRPQDPWGRWPNKNHRVLGSLLRRDIVPCVLTVNFDRLIEESTPEVPASRVVKLHGDIRHLGSIDAILPRVTSPIEGPGRDVLEQLMRTYAFCFAGYAGADVDIAPVLETAAGQHPIYWLLHPATAEANSVQVHRLFPHQGDALHLFALDIDAFFDLVGETFGVAQSVEDRQVGNTRIDYARHWRGWASRLHRWERQYIVGRIYQEIGARDEEVHYFRWSIKSARTPFERTLSLHRTGMAYLGRGSPIRAGLLLTSALFASLAGTQPRTPGGVRALILRDIGDLAYRTSRTIRRANEQTRRNPPLVSRMTLYVAAVLLSRSARTLAKHTSVDPRIRYEQRARLGLAFSHLGKVERERGDVAKAETYFKRALDQAEGERELRNYWLGAEVRLHRAILRLLDGRPSDAAPDLAASREMLERLGHAEGLERLDRALLEHRRDLGP